MSDNFTCSSLFRSKALHALGGLGVAMLLAACASTTVPIASPQGSGGPDAGRSTQRAGAGGAGDAGAAGANSGGAGKSAANEFNAAGGSDDSPANGFDIRRADRKGAAGGAAGAGASGSDDPNAMSGAGGNGSGGNGSGGNGSGSADGSSAGGGAGANGSSDGSDAAGAAGRRKGSSGGDMAGADSSGGAGTGGANGTSGTKGTGGAGAAGTAGAGGAAGGAGGSAGSQAGTGNGTGGAGGSSDAPSRLAMARDGGADGDAGADRRGRVETGKGGVQIDRDERVVTLGGALPTTLGMGEGQFEFDRFTLSDDVKSKLDVIWEKLGSEPYDRLYVTGYSDRIGDTDYNQKLSEKRAWAVAGYLMDKGIAPEKLKVEGKGETNSLVSGGECMALKRAELIQCLERDRRVELQATIKEYNLKVK